MKSTRKFVALLPALAMALPAAMAQEPEAAAEDAARRYAVEIIVFRYAEDVFSGNEMFPAEPAPEILDSDPADIAETPVPLAIDSTRLLPPEPEAGDEAALADDGEDSGEQDVAEPAPASGAILLLEDELTMGAVLRKLELLDAYEPLMHFGWTQPGLPEADAVPLELEFFGTPPAGLEGRLTLYLGRFLHLVVDLALDADPQPAPDPTEADEPVFRFGDARPQYDANDPFMATRERVLYRIQEDRIVRHGDIRYFDHPKFGVIAQLTRLESPAGPAEESLLPGVSR